ncbi:hypothetical protein NDU88_006466, partial [Pleurodeles waltl]
QETVRPPFCYHLETKSHKVQLLEDPIPKRKGNKVKFSTLSQQEIATLKAGKMTWTMN